MRIASVQMNPIAGEVEKNIHTMCEHIENAAAAGNDLVVFPEMSDTGYDMPTIVRTARNWADSTVSKLQDTARRCRVNVAAGVSEKEETNIYNSVAIIGRDGSLIGRHRKTHLITAEPMLEQNYLKAGDELTIVQIENAQFGIMTCYEIRFPEIARTLALKGAQVLLIPAAWPLVRLPHWTTLALARAIENQVFVIAANRIGSDGGVIFAGTTTIVDPYGVVLASASQIHEDVVVAKLNLERISVVRSQIKVHQDRRPTLYEMGK